MKKRKIAKIISATILATAGVGLIIGFFVDWNFPNWIYISGSSTVQPLISNISKIYQQAEIISEAGGSSTGISNVVANKKDVGATSRSPKVSEAGLPAAGGDPAISGIYANQWSSLKMKTITIGYDGIGIIYKATNIPPDVNLVINDNNIVQLYTAFSGQEILSLQDLNSSLPDKTIRPFARSGGSNTSGTAEAFLKESNLTLPDENDHKWEQIQNRLETGNYGANVQQTAESNIITWNNIRINSNDSNFAYMTYLSAGFIKNNYDEILKEGFKVAYYQDNQMSTPTPLIDENGELTVPNAYKWYRPLDLIFRLEDKNTKTLNTIKEFIVWLKTESLKPDSELLKIYDAAGYIPLTEEKWASMSLDKQFNWTNFWVSDYELYINQYQDRKQSKKYYGAI